MTEAHYFIIILCGLGLAYTSFRIGFREGSGKMVEFIKTKRNKQGFTLMHFYGEDIQFLDALDYNRSVLEAIGKVLPDDNDSA
jgi:hypothetical protein